MINLNVVSRISEDKDYFSNLINAIYLLKNKGITDVAVLFIGTIYSQPVYQKTIKLAYELGVAGDISFTQTSIPLQELSDEIKAGYFINFTIGQFTGFSGLEGIKYGLKTIFLNTDKALQNEAPGTIVQCRTLPELVDLITRIHANQDELNKAIRLSNQQMLDGLTLNPQSAQQLLNMMLPK